MVDALMGGPRRFGELADDVGRIAPNVLTARLRQLEIDGVVRATPYSRRPLRMEYELTDAGRELAGALALLAAWGRRQAGGAAGRARARPTAPSTGPAAPSWSPACGAPPVTGAVDDPEADELEHL